MRGGLQVIGARADALGRFTAAYAQLARLPAPTLAPVRLAHSGGPGRGTRAPPARLTVARRAEPSSSRPIPISSSSFSSTSCATPSTRRSRPRRRDRELGRRSTAASACAWTTRGPGCPTRRTCSCRSSRPSLGARASASCCAADRLPRRTAGSLTLENRTPGTRLPRRADTSARLSAPRELGHPKGCLHRKLDPVPACPGAGIPLPDVQTSAARGTGLPGVTALAGPGRPPARSCRSRRLIFD